MCRRSSSCALNNLPERSRSCAVCVLSQGRGTWRVEEGTGRFKNFKAVGTETFGALPPELQPPGQAFCPASSILSGQRQLDFPMLFERYQQQSGLWEKWESRGFCGISKGGGKGGKPAFGFPRFPPPGFFHSPLAAAFLLLKKSSIFTLLLRTPSQHPDSSWLVPCGNSGCSVPGLRNDGRADRLRPRWSS